jgi:hypothetical protein
MAHQKGSKRQMAGRTCGVGEASSGEDATNGTSQGGRLAQPSAAVIRYVGGEIPAG